MTETKTGFLLISDITGYTSFLSHSELEHAQDSLRTLVNLLIEHTRLPLVISNLEGDAVLSYALQGDYKQGQTLVDMMEETYVAFRRALELMVLNTSCTCQACRNLKKLDLKFFIHYGKFVVEKRQTNNELIGNDVVLVHRLLKNRVTEQTGIKAYTLYTQAAIDGLQMDGLAENAVRHVENYEHIGEVVTHVEDMHPIWERGREARREVVTPEQAQFTVEMDYPIPPALMWEYLTKPEYRAIQFGSDDQLLEEMKQGRIAPGSVYICAHGTITSRHTIVDWQPFEQFTASMTSLLGTHFLGTTKLEAIDSGTCVSMLVGRVHGPFLVRSIVNRLQNEIAIESGARALRDYIERDIEMGYVPQDVSVLFSDEQVASAVKESLTNDGN